MCEKRSLFIDALLYSAYVVALIAGVVIIVLLGFFALDFLALLGRGID